MKGEYQVYNYVMIEKELKKHLIEGRGNSLYLWVDNFNEVQLVQFDFKEKVVVEVSQAGRTH